MLIGICILPVIPMRGSTSDQSEMVNQILFGETFDIIDKKKNWSYVKLKHDNYIGWIDNKQYHIREAHNTDYQISNKLYSHITINSIQQPLIIGSLIPNNTRLAKDINMSQNINFCDVNPFEKGFINITKQYLNTPYLWGGRTSIGIDCSGFTQIIYRLFNIHLPRDAHQQAKVGSITKNIKLGDIAFFEKESKINHVGIILNNNQIIHASGKVRIDSIDSKGIFNKELNLYTHHLKYIKKILN
jgi:hypothetical protein